MTQGRPIGRQIRALCATLENYGPSDGMRLSRLCYEPRTSITKALIRAEDYGLVRVNRNREPFVFEVYTNWRETADAPRKPKTKAARHIPRVNSVFTWASA